MFTKSIDKTFLWIGVIFLVALEIYCAKLAFENLAEIISDFLLYIIVPINIIPILLLFSGKKIRLAIGILMVLGLIVVPYQLFLNDKLINLKEESANITAYLHKYEIVNKKLPSDLSGYTFSFPKLQKNFNYYIDKQSGKEQFYLTYFVGSNSTHHFYSSEDDKWGYNPD